MALTLKSPPPPADSPYTKVRPPSNVADDVRERNRHRSGKQPNRIYPKDEVVEGHRMSIVARATSRPLGLPARAAGVAIAEEIVANLEAKHTLAEGGSKAFLDTKRQLDAVGMHLHHDKEWQQYRVVPHADKKNKDLGYYTDDLEDALHTGLHIAKTTGVKKPEPKAATPTKGDPRFNHLSDKLGKMVFGL